MTGFIGFPVFPLKIMDTNKSFYVDATNSGSDFNAGDSVSSPWETLTKAFTELRKYYLLHGVIASIILLDGEHVYSADVSIEHPQGSQIVIKGQSKYDKSFTAASQSGSAGSYALTLTCSDTSNVEVGDFVIIDSASGGTNPEQAMGCHEVATVNTNTSIVVTSKNLGSLAPSGAVSSSGHVLKSIVNMGSNKLTVSGFGKIEDLVLTGSGTIVNGEDCVLQLSDIGIDGGGTAISLVRSKVSGNLVCSGATTSIKTVMCEGSLEGSVISGTSSAALIAQLSNLVLDNAVAVGCLNGFLADMGSSIHMQSGKSIGNISNGFYATNGSQGYLVLCKFQNNNVGVSANACSSLQVGLATISGNTTADASPTIGTVGNNESLITNTT